MGRSVIVTIFDASPSDIERSPDGTPRIESSSHHARVYLATSTGGGWMVETWAENHGESARQELGLIGDVDDLAASIAAAVRDIAGG